MTCGVRRTELHVLDGELPHPRFPIIPGHKIVGRIDAIVTDLRLDKCEEGHSRCNRRDRGRRRCAGGAAELLAVASWQDDACGLKSAARDKQADLIVAGAYGYGRLRERALGGVTRSLLQQIKCCALRSH